VLEAAARNASSASESAAGEAVDKADEVLLEQQFRANMEANKLAGVTIVPHGVIEWTNGQLDTVGWKHTESNRQPGDPSMETY